MASYGINAALVIEIHNNEPLRADDISELFAALSNDYRRISRGRDLVVARLSTGSLLAVFKDAAEIAAAANSVIDLGSSISYVFDLIKNHGSEIPAILKQLKRPGGASAEQILKAAINGNASVDLRYEGPQGEKLFAKIKPIEAQEMQITVTKSKDMKKLLVTQKGKSSLSSPKLMKEIGFSGESKAKIPSRKRLSDDALRLLLPKPSTHTTNSDIWNTIAETLNSHGPHIIQEVASNLEIHGQQTEASLLREAGNRISRRGTPPPRI